MPVPNVWTPISTTVNAIGKSSLSISESGVPGSSCVGTLSSESPSPRIRSELDGSRSSVSCASCAQSVTGLSFSGCVSANSSSKYHDLFLEIVRDTYLA